MLLHGEYGNCYIIKMPIESEDIYIRLRILSLTCFLRRFTIDDLVLCHFTARAFTDIDV